MNLENFIKENKANFNELKMPENSSLEFEAKLKNELHSSQRIIKLRTIKHISIAASFLLVMTIGYLINNNHKELVIRDNLVLALGQEQTNSERLQAIYENTFMVIICHLSTILLQFVNYLLHR